MGEDKKSLTLSSFQTPGQSLLEGDMLVDFRKLRKLLDFTGFPVTISVTKNKKITMSCAFLRLLINDSIKTLPSPI